MVWDFQHLNGKVTTRDIVQTAEAYVPLMKEQGADLIVALSHSGIDGAGQTDMMGNASLYLAGVEGIDVVFTGHHHNVFPSSQYDGIEGVDTEKGTLMGKPAVMAGFWGSHMGLIDLLIEHDGNEWKIISHSSEARPISERIERKVNPLVESDAAVLASVQKTHDETLEYVRTAVGQTDAKLHSYFALVADDPSVQVVSQAQMWYTEQMMRGTQWEACRSYQQLRHLRQAVAVAQTITPTFRLALLPLKTLQIFTSIQTPFVPLKSPVRASKNGLNGPLASSIKWNLEKLTSLWLTQISRPTTLM